MGHVPPSTPNNFSFGSLWSKSDSQLSTYCVVYEISWCRCEQLTALSIITALVTKLLVIEQLLHLAVKSAMGAPGDNYQLCPSSQQILATPLLEVQPIGQLGPITTGSGQNGLDLEKYVVNISKTATNRSCGYTNNHTWEVIGSLPIICYNRHYRLITGMDQN